MTKKTQKNHIVRFLSVFCLTLVTLLFAWPISLIGTRVGRLRSGRLQTPVRKYLHRESGRQVILFGMIHIGRPPYYKGIQHRIDQVVANGFTVLYEGVGKMDEHDIEALPAKERVIVRQIHSLSVFMQKVAPQLFKNEIIYQKHGLTYPDSWIRTDLEMSEIAALFAERNLDFLPVSVGELNESFLDDMPAGAQEILQSFFLGVIRLLPGIQAIRSWTAVLSQEKRARNEIIITMRDRVAVEGILLHAKNSDIASVWGAAHLPGIHKHLTSAGYVHVTSDWHDAL